MAPTEQDAADLVPAVGIGPGDPAFLSVHAVGIIHSADIVVGFETVLEQVAVHIEGESLACSYDDQPAVLAAFADRVAAGDRGVAVLWGDPSVSAEQFLDRVEAALGRAVRVVPGVSSVQVAAARARTPLEESTIASLHRRGPVDKELERLAATAGERHLHVLVRPYDWMPPAIAAALLERDADPGLEAIVFEELTLPAETRTRLPLGELAGIKEPPEEAYSDRTILTVRAP